MEFPCSLSLRYSALFTLDADLLCDWTFQIVRRLPSSFQDSKPMYAVKCFARPDQLKPLPTGIRLRVHVLLSSADECSACRLVSSASVERNTSGAGWRRTQCIVSVAAWSVSGAGAFVFWSCGRHWQVCVWWSRRA